MNKSQSGINEIFCSRLHTERLAKGVTYQEFADDLGLNRTSVWQWENGQTSPAVQQLTNIAKYFDCSIDYLLGLSDVRKINVEYIKLDDDTIKVASSYAALSDEQKLSIKTIVESLKK